VLSRFSSAVPVGTKAVRVIVVISPKSSSPAVPASAL